jgi:integrase
MIPSPHNQRLLPMHAWHTPREFDWPELSASAPVLTSTMIRYIDQLALSLRPSTVSTIDGILRRFAGYLTTHHPEIDSLAGVDRCHIEAFKKYLPTRPGKNGRPPLSKTTIGMTLGVLRTFFERVSEWDYPDAPTRVLIFNGDLPARDDPLPKFLSDSDAAKLMRTVAEEEPVRRLVIEMLARTGLRIGELCELAADAVVLISGRHWLRVPIGKLHNDRYIPLHPLLVELLDQHQSGRTDDIDRLILWNGRPVDRFHITRALNRAAKIAGIGHVHPHQLRHTFATQAINRGMSLEAIAAMLGHKTLRMTLVYARIADKTVADAYDNVTNQIDALYTKPTGLRTSSDGSTTMERLAAEYDQRMLGNGYCNRPSQLDCQFESICENCAHYSTDNTFNDVLTQQRDHAANRDQHQRIDLFNMLIARNQKAAQ